MYWRRMMESVPNDGSLLYKYSSCRYKYQEQYRGPRLIDTDARVTAPSPHWLRTGPCCLSGTHFYVLALYLCRYCTCMYFLPIVCRTDLQFIHRKCIYYSWISQSAWPDTNVERTVLFNNYSLSELSNQLFISISVSSFSLSALFCGGRVVERKSVSDVWRCCIELLVERAY